METKTSADTPVISKISTAKTNATGMGGTFDGKETDTKSTSASKTGTDMQSKKQKNLKEVFEDLLKDTYSAEKQLVKALPEVADAAYNDDLREAILDHLEETKVHVTRLERVFSKLRIDREEKTCKAMQGLIAENKEIIKEYAEGPVRDSALIIGSQKIEHYEIAAYGSLCELADVLGYHSANELLEDTLDEEENADDMLTDIAEDVNDEAYENMNEDTEDDDQ